PLCHVPSRLTARRPASPPPRRLSLLSWWPGDAPLLRDHDLEVVLDLLPKCLDSLLLRGFGEPIVILYATGLSLKLLNIRVDTLFCLLLLFGLGSQLAVFLPGAFQPHLEFVVRHLLCVDILAHVLLFLRLL